MTQQKMDRIAEDSPSAAENAKARQRLIEAALQVFAEKGYDRTLSRDIAAVAGVSPAAINYYFGGKDGLYEAVYREANKELVTLGQIEAILSAGKPPAESLRDLIRLLIHSLLSSKSCKCYLQLVTREMTAPTPALDSYIHEEFQPKVEGMRKIVAAVADFPVEHPVVAACTASVLAQCAFLFQNHRALTILFPDLILTPEHTEVISEHIFVFTLAGIQALAAKAKEV
ncbi:CerR family C-terminal domain-containing protein [Desulfocurvibacter africanus]|uniref:Transcriptional regulator TetR n=1 Tax=Desulfocurvibacter africanus subsp. africanus str. Walvis Bay TaxID=690850 RepID=F3Z1P2_DESAF|nr:CerR family C-terminal domain-containing protein [Desulfocurvibacter africanus]EGJ51177.1 Transcriptional regulator TetR [Desulfocurvibacter africanus subsp. africanus str. Walvis Bay]